MFLGTYVADRRRHFAGGAGLLLRRTQHDEIEALAAEAEEKAIGDGPEGLCGMGRHGERRVDSGRGLNASR